MKFNCLLLFSLITLGFSYSGCYSFKNASVSPDLKYFFVDDFRITARNAPATIDNDFQEALKNKIRNESRLVLDREKAQIIFSGAVSGYSVQALAPQPGETVALNRLQITVNIKYQDLENEDKAWDQSFNEYAEFGSDLTLTDVEAELIITIFDQLTENIFNKAFGDW
jgi:hypothetical protein